MSLGFFLVEFGAVERLPVVCAVTALDEPDGLALIREAFMPEGNLPDPARVESLTPEAIQTRIGRFDFGLPLTRGIWYPHIDNP